VVGIALIIVGGAPEEEYLSAKVEERLTQIAGHGVLAADRIGFVARVIA
jgi:hypothetical protein